MEKSDLTEQILAAAMKVHTELGPGVLESAYEVCLEHERRKRGFKLLSYLRRSGKRIGLLLNFHEVHLRDGITRKINDRVTA
jgi:hypothetical protein